MGHEAIPIVELDEPAYHEPSFQQPALVPTVYSQQPIFNNNSYIPVPTHAQQHQPHTIIAPETYASATAKRTNNDEDLVISASLFGIGWLGLFCGLCCAWLGGVVYLRSPNRHARSFAIASLASCAIFTLVWIGVIVGILMAARQIQ